MSIKITCCACACLPFFCVNILSILLRKVVVASTTSKFRMLVCCLDFTFCSYSIKPKTSAAAYVVKFVDDSDQISFFNGSGSWKRGGIALREREEMMRREKGQSIRRSVYIPTSILLPVLWVLEKVCLIIIGRSHSSISVVRNNSRLLRN